MKFESTEVWGWEHSLRGMRNPMNSWNKSDTMFENCGFYIGENDMNLAQRLIIAGSEHRKFMRQIFVSVDITAPLYWWSEFDTYKVGTTANSTSKMHKLSSTPITLDCFEIDDYNPNFNNNFFDFISSLESLRKKHLETKDKRYWKELIRLLPESWLQTRTVTMTYENLYSMIRQRYNHKLNEWSGKDDNSRTNFISWCRTLPYADSLLFLGLEDNE